MLNGCSLDGSSFCGRRWDAYGNASKFNLNIRIIIIIIIMRHHAIHTWWGIAVASQSCDDSFGLKT